MRKKLFAVIMSVMMMVTFMPAMAFAANDGTATLKEVVWSDDYTSATATYYLQYGTTGLDKTYSLDVERAFVKDGSADFTEVVPGTDISSRNDLNGMVVARAGLKTGPISYSGKTLDVNNGVGSPTYVEEAYYDLTGASFVTTNPKTGVHEMNAKTYYEMINQDKEYTTPEFADKNNDGKADYDVTNLFGNGTTVKVNFVQPADLAGTAKQKEVAVDLSAGALANIGKLEYVLPRYELYDEAAALDLTIKFVNPLKHVINADKFKQDYKLSLYVSDVSMVEVKMDGIEKAVPVYSQTSTQTGVSTFNSTSKMNTINTVYRGANQNFQVASKGVTVTYSTDYKRTWTETAPEITDVDEYSFLMKVTRKDCEDQIFSITVKVNPAFIKLAPKAPQMGFPVGYKLNVSDVVDVKVQKYYNTSANASKYEVLNNAAVTAGLEKYVTLGSYQSQGGFSGNQSIAVNFDKEAFDADVKKDEALAKIAKSYKNLITEPVNVNFGVAYNDVTAPSQVKTYHVKNAKALKKNQKKFQLKAVADFGTPTFIKLSGNSKIKVYNNGKVLVKKGLKKGKYVVKVKVKAPGATATKKLTVKVVK